MLITISSPPLPANRCSGWYRAGRSPEPPGSDAGHLWPERALTPGSTTGSPWRASIARASPIVEHALPGWQRPLEDGERAGRERQHGRSLCQAARGGRNRIRTFRRVLHERIVTSQLVDVDRLRLPGPEQLEGQAQLRLLSTMPVDRRDREPARIARTGAAEIECGYHVDIGDAADDARRRRRPSDDVHAHVGRERLTRRCVLRLECRVEHQPPGVVAV